MHPILVGLEDGNAVHLTPNCFTPYPEVVFTADDSNNFHNTVTIEYICTDNSGSVVSHFHILFNCL